MAEEQWTFSKLAEHAQEMAQGLIATQEELAGLEHTARPPAGW